RATERSGPSHRSTGGLPLNPSARWYVSRMKAIVGGGTRASTLAGLGAADRRGGDHRRPAVAARQRCVPRRATPDQRLGGAGRARCRRAHHGVERLALAAGGGRARGTAAVAYRRRALLPG